MLNLEDQAEGLRKILGNKVTQRFTILSAVSKEHKNSILLNLSISLAKQGASVQLVDAHHKEEGISSINNNKTKNSLEDVVRGSATLESSVYSVFPNTDLIQFFNHSVSSRENLTNLIENIVNLFNQRITKSMFSFIDTNIDDDITKYLQEKTNNQVIILVSNEKESVKQAYGLLKKLNTSIKNLKVHVLVNGGQVDEAVIIQRNISRTVKKFLSLSTTSLGMVIHDDQLSESIKLGQLVVEMHPNAQSSKSYQQMASRIFNQGQVKMRAGENELLSSSLEGVH